eukprot:44317_1
MGAECCAGDPSQTKAETNMKDALLDDEEGRTTPGEEQEDLKPVTKQATDSYLQPKPTDQEVEESLLVPSTLSIFEDQHDPVPPSDYEDNPDEYTVKHNENPLNKDRVDDEEAVQEDANDNAPEEDRDDSNKDTNDEANDGVIVDSQPGMAEPVEDAKEDVSANVDTDKAKEVEQEPEPEPEAPKATNKGKKSKKDKQNDILESAELRQRSVALVTGDDREFIKFLKKILKSKLNEKIWAKCDPKGTKRIETDKFLYFWTLPTTLFKVAIYQRKHGNKKKPKLDQKELKKDFTHLATWIIRREGEEQEDGSYAFVLTKDNFSKDIVDYVRAYADCEGKLLNEEK